MALLPHYSLPCKFSLRRGIGMMTHRTFATHLLLRMTAHMGAGSGSGSYRAAACA